MPVATRSRVSMAKSDVAAIQQSVPSVRNVVLPKKGKSNGSESRPSSAASSAKSIMSTKSMPTTVGTSGRGTESFPLVTPTKTPRRTRGKTRGTRSTPSTPPSHQRMFPKSLRSPRARGKTPGSGGDCGHYDGSDYGESEPSSPKSVNAHVTQFAESLKALRELGLAGIKDLDNIESRFINEEQESEQMRVLLDERSRARDLVRQLEREKQLQAEELRLMEQRIVEQELTEEEFFQAEEAVNKYHLETLDLTAKKDALERELALQTEREGWWSKRLRALESEEEKLVATAEKAEKALLEKSAEAALLASKLTDAQLELDALRAREVGNEERRAGEASGSGNEVGSGDDKDGDALGEKSAAMRKGSVKSKGKTLTAKSARAVSCAVSTRSATQNSNRKEGNGESAEGGGAPEKTKKRKGFFFGIFVCAVGASAIGLAPHSTQIKLLDTVGVVYGKMYNLVMRFEGFETFVRGLGTSTSTSVDSNASGLKNAVTYDTVSTLSSSTTDSPPWLWFEENKKDGNVDGTDRKSEDGTEKFDASHDANTLSAGPGEPVGVVGTDKKETVHGVAHEGVQESKSARDIPPEAPPTAPVPKLSVLPPHKRTPSTPLLCESELDKRNAEELVWDSVVEKGWSAGRRLGGSDRRARVKTASRRAEGAVLVAKEARVVTTHASERYELIVADIAALDGGGSDDAERQRLTLASHEIDAESSGSERKWESLRGKAVQSVRALETELRALG